jgi:hypothetical protein
LLAIRSRATSETIALPEGTTDEADLTCSARGCRQVATFDLRWNNPKIHPAERRKHWLACEDHRDSLSRFLAARGFLRDVEPLTSDG